MVGDFLFSGKPSRREERLTINWPALIEKMSERRQALPPELEPVYERVRAEASNVGQRFKMRLRDLSVNGAFLEGEPLPLNSRLALVFDMPDFQRVECIGWVLWRRKDRCQIRDTDGQSTELGAGVGILFEWITPEARAEIMRRIGNN